MVSELDRFRQMSVAFVERKKQKLQEFLNIAGKTALMTTIEIWLQLKGAQGIYSWLS